MSISMQQFGSYEQLLESRVSSGSRGPAFPYRLQCRACSFEPFDAITRPLRCPKCAGSAREQFAFPANLLVNADRRVNNSSALRSSFARAEAI
jgi:hypothetical protein